MQSLLAIYGEGVARGVSCFGCFGLIGALALAAANYDNWQFARKCLWTALAFAVVLILFPGPEFFKALAGRP